MKVKIIKGLAICTFAFTWQLYTIHFHAGKFLFIKNISFGTFTIVFGWVHVNGSLQLRAIKKRFVCLNYINRLLWLWNYIELLFIRIESNTFEKLIGNYKRVILKVILVNVNIIGRFKILHVIVMIFYNETILIIFIIIACDQNLI